MLSVHRHARVHLGEFRQTVQPCGIEVWRARGPLVEKDQSLPSREKRSRAARRVRGARESQVLVRFSWTEWPHGGVFVFEITLVMLFVIRYVKCNTHGQHRSILAIGCYAESGMLTWYDGFHEGAVHSCRVVRAPYS